MSILSNLASVRERMEAAARHARRSPSEIELVAVSKTQPPQAIREAYAAGQRVFGENRVQEFAEKAGHVADLLEATWHLIGHLQSNKAARAAQLFASIDSLDSLRLAERLNEAAAKGGTPLSVLLEVNVGGEAAKSGVAPGSPELQAMLEAAPRLEHLRIRGLMTIPPYTENPEDARPYFRRLRRLRDEIAQRRMPAVAMDVLSMGMSHDFEIAIQEGSTCVRVGTAIFGPRTKA